MYENGKGVAKDYAEALTWYRKAAEQDSLGQNNLGWMYLDGRGVRKDANEAVRWFRLAAAQGEQYAQYNLGRCYENSWGVERDFSEAARWYSLAAEQGHSFAQTYLGRLYEHGLGVSRDLQQAMQWYRKAAEQEHDFAQADLGKLYEHGLGVAKDLGEAQKWYGKAAAQGNRFAQVQLRNLEAAGGPPQGVVRPVVPRDTAILEIDAPPSARILIDGEVVGKNRWTYQPFSPGQRVEHDVLVRLADGKEMRRRVLLQGGWHVRVPMGPPLAGPEVVVQTGHSHTIWSMAFSRDGKLAATGSVDCYRHFVGCRQRPKAAALPGA